MTASSSEPSPFGLIEAGDTLASSGVPGVGGGTATPPNEPLAGRAASPEAATASMRQPATASGLTGTPVPPRPFHVQRTVGPEPGPSAIVPPKRSTMRTVQDVAPATRAPNWMG